MLQTATHCNICIKLPHEAPQIIPTAFLQHTATYCNTLEHTVAHQNTLEHTETYSNTLQHTAPHGITYSIPAKETNLSAKETPPLYIMSANDNTMTNNSYHLSAQRPQSPHILSAKEANIPYNTKSKETTPRKTNLRRLSYLEGTLLQHCNALKHCNTLAAVVLPWRYTLPRTATHCNTLKRTAVLCVTLQPTATHCNTLQHAATRCNTLQHTCSGYSALQVASSSITHSNV